MANQQQTQQATSNGRARLRDVVPGINLGVWPTGPLNGLTDVPGVLVNTVELHADGADDTSINTGITTILPRKDWANSGCYAGLFRFNGAGDLTGTHYIEEYGKVATPIVLTNSLSVPAAYQGILEYIVKHYGDPDFGIGYFLVPVVAETFDGYLNDLSAFAVKPSHVLESIAAASSDPVPEGNRGGGTGMICQGFKGGTGTSSRVVVAAAEGQQKASSSGDKIDAPSADSADAAAADSAKKYTVAALVQANFGSQCNLRIAGVPIGRILADERAAAAAAAGDSPPGPTEADKAKEQRDGSIIVVLATDAPLHPLQCQRLAKRATAGLARTGGYGQNPSGDIFLAFSTANHVPVQCFTKKPDVASIDPFKPTTYPVEVVDDESINGIFEAAADATEEAIYNALCSAETMTGFKGHKIEALPLDRVKELLEKYMA